MMFVCRTLIDEMSTFGSGRLKIRVSGSSAEYTIDGQPVEASVWRDVLALVAAERRSAAGQRGVNRAARSEARNARWIQRREVVKRAIESHTTPVTRTRLAIDTGLCIPDIRRSVSELVADPSSGIALVDPSDTRSAVYVRGVSS